jgi:hypothetical protein
MRLHPYLNTFAVRNLFGLLAVLLAHYIPDYYHLEQRTGLAAWTPYFYLVLLYGWLIVHNRLLFDRLLLRAKVSAYAGWLLLGLGVSSFNMHFILQSGFGVTRTLPYMVSFCLYTVTGLGVYVTYRYLQGLRWQSEESHFPVAAPAVANHSAHFTCTVDGSDCRIPYPDILYVESLENYLKIVTPVKTFITRLTLKEAEARLPKPGFVRVSKSHLVNSARIDHRTPEVVTIGDKSFRIGRVYKHYVLEQLSA